MTLVLALAGCIGEAAILYTLIILARLSQKLGAVTKMPPYYRGFYLSVALLCVSLASRLVHLSAALTEAGQTMPLLAEEGFALATHHLPMALAMLISVLVAGRYWGWLLKE